MENEKVLVVNTEDLRALTGNETGFLQFDQRILDLIKTKSFFVNRSDAENDETKKQIIPYCMVVNGNKILAVKRKAPGEKRLKGLLSVGIGGHINPQDRGADTLSNAATRELREETSFTGNVTSRAVGFLSLDGTPVDRVHFGVVYKVDLGDDVTVIDNGLEGSFIPVNELGSLADKMEGWSKVLAGKVPTGKI